MGGIEVTVKAYVCGSVDTMLMRRRRRRDGHRLGTRACAGAQIALPHNIMPVLHQSSAPHIAVGLGKCVCSAPQQEEMGLTPLSLCYLPAPINLNPARLCLCAHQSISAQATSPGPYRELEVRTPYKKFCASALRRTKIPKEPAGNRALVIDPLLVPPSSCVSACALSRALPAICQLGQRIPAH